MEHTPATGPDITDTVTPKSSQWRGTRRGDGGTYLVIVDGSEEMRIAVDYACALALTRRGHVALAHITHLDDFVHWGSVEALMRDDLRKKAEQDVWQIAKTINDEYGLTPCLHIHEGQVSDKIVDIIDNDRLIRSLILAGSKTPGNPGPLIQYFCGKGMARLRVPVVIVPGHFDKEKIDSVTNPLRLGLG